MHKYKNIFYVHTIYEVGGTETFLYYIAKKYCDYDICIMYKHADEKQIARLKQYVAVKQFNNEPIECDKIFYNYNPDIIEYVTAKEHIQIFHTNYKKVGIKPSRHPKITKYLGVSKYVCDSMKENFDIDAELCYNPLEPDNPKKVLRLVSATRLTWEKGKGRINKLCEILDKAKIPYIWSIFTNDDRAIANPNVYFFPVRFDISTFIKDADYLVQLSDDLEGYGYTVAEALKLGTPVIVTDCTAFKEIGVKDKENAFVVDFDLSNVNVQDIYKKHLKFEYSEPRDSYDKYLEKGESLFMRNKKIMCEVEAIIDPDFLDVQLNEVKELGARYIVDKNRADDLEFKGLVKIIREFDENEEKKEVKAEETTEETPRIKKRRIRK